MSSRAVHVRERLMSTFTICGIRLTDGARSVQRSGMAAATCKRCRNRLGLRDEDQTKATCAATVYTDVFGRHLDEPRRCRFTAKFGHQLCHVHLRACRDVTSSAGGWCVWCGGAARRYEGPNRVAIDLCVSCSDGLVREIRKFVPSWPGKRTAYLEEGAPS